MGPVAKAKISKSPQLCVRYAATYLQHPCTASPHAVKMSRARMRQRYPQERSNDREASEVRMRNLAYLYATFRKLRQTYDAKPYANLIYICQLMQPYACSCFGSPTIRGHNSITVISFTNNLFIGQCDKLVVRVSQRAAC